MPKRRKLPSQQTPPQQTPRLPALIIDEAGAKNYAQIILNRLSSLPTTHDPPRAACYQRLAEDYRDLMMYGRTLQMYEASLHEQDSLDVRTELAWLLINLEGQAGIEKVRRTLFPKTDLRTVTYNGLSLDQWITRKQQAIARARRKTALEKEYSHLANIAGQSQHIIGISEQIIKVAPTDLSVLITGATGTGKEVVAHAIHACSKRHAKPFVPVNCAGLPQELIESELFGHERGAFTGAVGRRVGRLEQAHGGTLFLDEVGDFSLAAQAKILRALQEKAIDPVGGTQSVKVDVRVIAATNQPLGDLMESRQFRADLYDRLNGVRFTLKPLEERLEDIQPLVNHFIRRHGLALAAEGYSPYDIFHWVDACYLRSESAAFPNGEEDPKTLPEIVQECRRHRIRPKDQVPPRKTVRTLENAVRRAAAEGSLGRYGPYAFVDVLLYGDQIAVGPTVCTEEEIERYDWTIALELFRFQKDAGPFMGIDDSKKVSKILMELGLSKKQRKVHQAQRRG